MTVRRTSVDVCDQAGVTLAELMISIALGLFVTLAATALLISAKSGYLLQDDNAQMQDTARYALDVIRRTVRQSAYENWDGPAPLTLAPSMSANLSGLDARSLKATGAGVEAPLAKAVNGSDVLAVRFFGSGAGNGGDGAMINCAGFGVGAAGTGDSTDRRGWSVFYVAEDETGEPQLYCKYRGAGNWTSQAIARGVESFQILYGLDTDADGLPNRFLNASAIDVLDGALVLEGDNAMQRDADMNRKTHWKDVVAIKLALLLRGAHLTQGGQSSTEYHLFGQDYSRLRAKSDPGVHIREVDLPKAVQGRTRKVFIATIDLRRRPAESAR